MIFVHISECLLHLKPDSFETSALAFEELLVPALQTRSKSWPATQICQFILPVSKSYSIISKNHSKKSNIYSKKCSIKLQFSQAAKNLTDLVCLGPIKALDSAKSSAKVVLKVFLKSYSTLDLLEFVKNYQLLALDSKERVVRHSGDHRVLQSQQMCGGEDLVKFEEGFTGKAL